MLIDFTKMSGAGNDFIVLGPERASLKGKAPRLARVMCARRTSVGADGLIILENSDEGLYMHYFNSDGSEASLCGNGARCVTAYCISKGMGRGRITFASKSGRHAGEAVDGGFRVTMPTPVLVGESVIEIEGITYSVSLVDSGVPHAVIQVDDVGKIDVERTGRKIRFHEAFGKQGANVDFIAPAPDGTYAIRTYERGVELETLACGSGCTAAALFLRDRQAIAGAVRFGVASGSILTVELPLKGVGGVAYLTGPAEIVYEGRIDIKESGHV
jgi:diaminopimelate epimerase